MLVKDVTVSKGATAIGVAVRWQTDACTTVEIPRPPRSCDLRRTPPATVERIRALVPTHTDAQIAALLQDDDGLFVCRDVFFGGAGSKTQARHRKLGGAAGAATKQFLAAIGPRSA